MGVACSCKSDSSDGIEDGIGRSEFSKIRGKLYICVVAVAKKVEAKLIKERLPWYQNLNWVIDPDSDDF